MRGLAVALLVLAVAGCAAPPVPKDRFFRLQPPAGVSPAAATLPNSVVVQAPRVDGLHNERAIIYSVDPGHRELLQYHYRYWSAPPAELVQDYLVAYLRRAGVAGRVTRGYGDGYTDHVVSGHLMGFEQLVDGGAHTAAVDVELALTPPGAERSAFSRRYTQRVAVAGGTMADTVEAFEAALFKIAAAFADDLVREGAAAR